MVLPQLPRPLLASSSVQLLHFPIRRFLQSLISRSMAVVELKSHAHRDVLFAAGCGLVGFGLFPYLHARYYTWYYSYMSDSDSSSSFSEFERDLYGPSPPAFAVYPTTNTAFDLVTCLVGLAFALLGVGVMFLSCLVLPRYSTRVCLKTVGVPLFVVAMGAAMLVYGFYTDSGMAKAWQMSALQSFSDEGHDGPLENQVNLEFCRAFGDHVCLDGSIQDAQELFTQVPEWRTTATDTDSANIQTTSVSSVCGDSSRALKDLNKAENVKSVNQNQNQPLCRACNSITRHPMSQRPEKLLMIKSPSRDAIHWCGEYLTTWNVGVNLDKSPFQQHHEEILSHWADHDDDDDSPVSLTLAVRLLVVLVWFSLPSLAVMTRWYFVPEIEDWDWSAVSYA